jgi:hypothetical protein
MKREAEQAEKQLAEWNKEVEKATAEAFQQAKRYRQLMRARAAAAEAAEAAEGAGYQD